MSRIYFAIVIFLVAGVAAPAARAAPEVMIFLQNTSPASGSDIAAAFGDVQYHVDCPAVPEHPDEAKIAELSNQRRVNATIKRDSDRYNEPNLVAGILSAARDAAYRDCPLIFYGFGEQDRYSYLSGGTIDVYLGSGSRRELLVHAEDFSQDGIGRTWDRRAERRLAEEATHLEEEKAAAQQAQAQAAAEAQNEHAMQQAAQQAQTTTPQAQSSQWSFGWLWFLLLCAGSYFLWSNLDAIIRFWYELTPHPAQDIVDRAIHGGERIDIEELKNSLNTDTRDPIEQSVREAQLAAATAQLREHEANLRAEEARRLRGAKELEERRAAAARDIDLTRAEEDLLRATLTHQTAAARVERLRRKRDDEFE